MAADPLRLAALAQTSIESATTALLAGGSASAWEREMQAILARAHAAAYLTGLGERSAGGKAREWLSKLVGTRALAKDDRAALTAIVKQQLAYLASFTKDLAGLSDAQIAARAQLYAGATRQTLYAARWGDWDIPPDLMPGNQQCTANCKCKISVKDSGDGTGVLTREMGGTEHHCVECPKLVGDHPVKRKAA